MPVRTGVALGMTPVWNQGMAVLACLDVKTALDVAKPSVVSWILSLTGFHGHAAAALLAELQDVQRSACLENCKTEYR